MESFRGIVIIEKSRLPDKPVVLATYSSNLKWITIYEKHFRFQQRVRTFL